MAILQDLTGQRFGKLIVIERVGTNKHGVPTWNCICDCENYRVVEGARLKAKSYPVTSCGCTDKKANHGMSNQKIFRVWVSMIERCTKEYSRGYRHYGGRGIRVCQRWLRFENFIEDMGIPPKGYTLERISNDGNYEPSNCRWATYEEQANNKRNNKYFEYDGKKLTLAQWSRLTGIPRDCLKDRLYYYGWSVERALTTPARAHKPYAKSRN